MLTMKGRRSERRDKRHGGRVLSWRARKQPGGVYCSRACGCGCTRASYDRAKERAALLATVANRIWKGWRPRVWENGGWHHSVQRVVRGRVVAEVHERKEYAVGRAVETMRFWCDIQIAGQQYVGEGKTVADAYRDARAKARTHAENLACDVSAL
jgi:hypothetical protein